MYFELRESAHQGFLKSYRALLDENHIDPQTTMSTAKPIIKTLLITNNTVRQRVVLCLSILFIKFFDDIDIRKESFYFASKAERILSDYFIDGAIDRCFAKILMSIDNFIRNGSGWSILHIQYIDLHIGNIYHELGGGCGNIKLPPELKKKVS